MKKIIIYLILIVVIVLLGWNKYSRSQKSSEQAGPPKNMPVMVSTYTVATQTTSHQISSTGNILAEEEVVLYPETQGRITQIAFTEGSEVNKGALLIKLNDADLQAQLKKAQSTLRLKDDTEKRSRQLLDKGAISQETYDIARNELNSIQADIDLIKEQIRKTEIRAPFSGRIGLRNVSEGSFVNSSTRIAALQNISQVKIEFSVPEKYAASINNGSTIQFNTDGKSTPVAARIYAIEPKVDEVTRNVIMRAICANPNRSLLPGAFVRVMVPVEANKNAVLVPTQAVVPILKGQKVFVVQGDSAVERKIKTGIRQDKYIEVTEGLNNGDKVVVEGVMYMKPGAKVKVKGNQQ